MAEQPIDKNQIIKDGTIPDVIKEFKDWESQLKAINRQLIALAKNTVIKPAVSTEDTVKLLAKVEKLEALYKKQSKNTKQLTTIERERLKLTKATETAEAKKIIAINKENKALIELQHETNKANKAQRDSIKVSERQKNAYSKLSDETNKYKNESKRLGAELLVLESDGKKLSKEWFKLSKAYDKATVSARKGDEQLKKLDKRVGDNQRKVGLYENATRRLSSALGALGIAFGIQQISSFANNLIEINSESKGVTFAFERLGIRGVEAFNKIKASTRGLLSDLDIKKSINEFENFNLSLEQSDTLFEFLAVTAAQTGKSVEYLRSSLVEGLSKESKLRIDNLGISAAELNEELEKTPSFIDAVANIAERKLVKAGDILDEAGSKQQLWNAQIENTKERLANGLQPVFETVFNAAATSLRFITENFVFFGKVIGVAITAISAYKVVVISTSLATKAWALVTSGATLAQTLYNAVLLASVVATKAFNITMKANPLGLIIALLAAATAAYFAFNESINLAKEAQDRFNEARSESLDIQRKINKEEKDLIDDRFNNLDQDAERRKLLGENDKKVEIENLKAKLEILDEEKRLAIEEQKNIETRIKNREALRKSLQGEANPYSNLSTTDLQKQSQIASSLDADLKGKIDGIIEKQEEYSARIADLSNETENKVIEKSNKGVGEAIKKATNLETLLRRLQDLRDQSIQDDEARQIALINRKFDREIEAIKGNSKIETDLIKELEYAKQEAILKIQGEYLRKQLEAKIKAEEEAKFTLVNDLPSTPEEDPLFDKDSNSITEQVKDREEAVANLKETYTNVLNSVYSTYQTLNSMVSDSIDTAIEGQNRLISNSQRTIDMIKQSAIAGNEQAKESILAEEKAIEESQKRIEKAQKRKQRMELISTGINTFNQKVASGQGGLQALGETGAQMAGLIGLLNALPSFFIGADRLSSDGSPVDNKGGFLAINHPDERIVPASKNKMIGFDTSNEKLANIMSYYNKGLLVPAGQVGVMQVQNDNSEVLKSIENGFSKINNYTMSVEELFGQISVIVEQKKNGNIHRSKKTFN